MKRPKAKSRARIRGGGERRIGLILEPDFSEALLDLVIDPSTSPSVGG
jgi:hypothetical protein